MIFFIMSFKCFKLSYNEFRKVAKEHRIPFKFSADPFYSESNIRYFNKVIDGIENGTRPLTEHDSIAIATVKGHYDD